MGGLPSQVGSPSSYQRVLNEPHESETPVLLSLPTGWVAQRLGRAWGVGVSVVFQRPDLIAQVGGALKLQPR